MSRRRQRSITQSVVAKKRYKRSQQIIRNRQFKRGSDLSRFMNRPVVQIGDVLYVVTNHVQDENVYSPTE